MASTLGGALLAAGAALATRRPDLDGRWTRRLTGHPHPVLDRVAATATELGSVYALVSAAGMLWACGQRRAASDVLGAGLVAWGAAQATKPLLDRRRPYEREGVPRLVAPPAGAAWPSGHPAVVAAVVVATRDGVGPVPYVVGWLTAAAVAWSRLYVGVHYLGDVLGGLGLGATVGALWRSWRRRGPLRS